MVESFAKEQLLDLLNAKCETRNVLFSQRDKLHFFGEYVSTSDKFQFSGDEKKLILSLSICAKQLFESYDIDSGLKKMSLNDPTDIFLCSDWYFHDYEELIIGFNAHESPVDFTVEEERLPQKDSQQIPVQIDSQTHTHLILNKLLQTANQNASRSKAGYRFDPEVKSWAAYLRMLSGPIAYNSLQKKFELALPSLSRINYFVQNTHNTTIEGVLRDEELLIYLNEKKLPLHVSISEDATFIVDRVQYNSKKNQLIGFVLPINRYGMPKPFVYSARDTDEIVRYFIKKLPEAKSVSTVMAQPIQDGPAFPLLLFGTDSKFVAEDVSQRWDFIANKLHLLGITSITFSSDADPKYLSAMKKNSHLGRRSEIFGGANWFKCGRKATPPFNVQDTVHLGTKSRNLLFKTMKDHTRLQLGNYFIQISHLQYIADKIPKDQHEITQSVLDPTDRQNFDSVLRICDSRVLAILEKYVNGSNGTIKFLEIVKNFLDAYIDYSLSPLERVSKLWYALFLVRIWRIFVLNHKTLTLKYNFLTLNTYTCMEQNAHSMVVILLYLKENNQPNLFKPWMYSSQPCESFYRQIRAFTPCNSTMTNCTVKEILDRIHKIQLQNEISCDPTTNFIFHKQKSSHSSSSNCFELPTEQEILATINKCKIQAVEDSIKLGLIGKNQRNMNLECNIVPYSPKKKSPNRAKSDETFSEFQGDEEFEAHMEILDQLKTVNMKNFADKFEDDEPVAETSPYTEVFGGKNRIILKKQSLVWLLRKKEKKLSSDRLQRVKADRRVSANKKYSKTKKRKNKYHLTGYISSKFICSKRSKKTKCLSQ